MTNRAAQDGARQIISRCLGLNAGQELLILADETTVDVAMLLTEAAYELGVSQTTILVPMAFQQRIPQEMKLSLPISSVLREVRAIVTCINGLPDCFLFRDYILENERGARTRLGHMPGATLDVLTMANVDFDVLIADCRRLELAMLRGQKLELVSHASDQKEYRLAVDIGGWQRLPVASDGIIREGMWGNVPSGETYIAPIEGSAEGSVVINGSIPDMVIEPGQEFILHFAGGRMIAAEPEDCSAARWLFATHIEPAIARQDSHWSNLAEIGIGVNPAVSHLTGNMIFDEKAWGTAHIALGSSTFMGGAVQSTIHCDMVISRPTIFIDGKVVIANGTLHCDISDWRENFAQISLSNSPIAISKKLARSGAHGELRDGRLRRIIRSETGRVSECWVGDDETARLAGRLYTSLPEDSALISIDRLIARSHLEPTIARQVLHIMRDYGLVKFEDNWRGTKR